MTTAIRLTFCCFLVVMTSVFNVQAQDADGDDINDLLEAALAARFAPEWRFNRWQAGDGSNQNNAECSYPSAIEQWFQDVIDQTSVHPHLLITHPVDSDIELTIMDIGELDDILNPYTSQSVSEEPGLYEYKITNYPDNMGGDPDGFTTYYRCNPDTYYPNAIRIAYILFYPYDEKAAPDIAGNLGDHTGDWAGINIRVQDVTDFSDPNSASSAYISRIFYGGHGEKKMIYPSNPNYYHVGDHSSVYVSRGAHACFPRPGEWHNFDVEKWWDLFGWANIYDDMFRGDGLVVQSGSDNYPLLNLGESDDAFVGWLNYKGQWGQDGPPDGKNSSPGGPTTKDEYYGNFDDEDVFDWDYLVENGDSYDDPFEPVSTSQTAGWHANGDPVVVFWNDSHWDNLEDLVSGPMEYPDTSSTGLMYNGLTTNSILLVGPIKVLLYSGLNYTGVQKVVTRSTREISFATMSMKIELEDGSFTCDEVVDYEATGVADGTWGQPHSTVAEGVDEVVVGGSVCISPGNYPENLLIKKPLTLRAYGGSVKIGAQ